MQSPVIDLEAEKAAAQALRERARTVPCAYCGSMMAYGHRDLHPTKMRIKQLINGREVWDWRSFIWCCTRCRDGDRVVTEKNYREAMRLLYTTVPLPCAYCDETMTLRRDHLAPTKDHLWPRGTRSMEDGRSGTVWCCAKCNRRKADMMPSAWLAMLISS